MSGLAAGSTPAAPAVATGTLSSNNDSSRERDTDCHNNEPAEAPGARGGKAFTRLGARADWQHPLPFYRHID
jgi:hypothetical protein